MICKLKCCEIEEACTEFKIILDNLVLEDSY